MARAFRLAIVGTGMIAGGSHLPAALASSMVEVVALVDPVTERAAQLAQDYGINPRVVASIDEVIPEIDGAIIATPNDTHAAIAVRCLTRGVPVLIEKPLASTYQDGCAIIRAAEEHRRVVAVGYSTRFRDEIPLLKELLDAGHFGAVRRFAHQFGTSGGWAPFSAYNLNRKTAGGGVLVVTGTHFLDRLLYLWGFPDEVLLEDDSLGGPEANCTASFRYAGPGKRFEGIARYSKTVKLPAGMVIETENGFVMLGESDDDEIIFRPHAKPGLEEIVRRRRRASSKEGARRSVFELQLEDFVEACRTGRPPVVDGRQGLGSLKLLEQLYANRRAVDHAWYERVAPRATV